MRAIDADALMEFARNHVDHKVDCNDIARFPTLDCKPVRHGEWVQGKWATYPDGYVCNRCSTGYAIPYNYCPNCGAKMDGGKEDG